MLDMLPGARALGIGAIVVVGLVAIGAIQQQRSGGEVCTASTVTPAGGASIIGPQSAGCSNADLALNALAAQQTVEGGTTSAELAFPDQVFAFTPPEAPAAPAPVPVSSAPGERVSAAGTFRQPPAPAPQNQGPPPPEVAVQLFRALGLPLPRLQPNGTFESNLPAEGPMVNQHQGAGGAGAPSEIFLDGTSLGVPQGGAQPPAPDPGPPPGQGGEGTTAPGSPGLPGN